MSADQTTVVASGGGFEAWCEVCGSVAYLADEHDGEALATEAALLHEDNDHCAIWLNSEGWPTTTNTGHYAGGCLSLRGLGNPKTGARSGSLNPHSTL